MVLATLAFLGAFGADQSLLTYFADISKSWASDTAEFQIVGQRTDINIRQTFHVDALRHRAIYDSHFLHFLLLKSCVACKLKRRGQDHTIDHLFSLATTC